MPTGSTTKARASQFTRKSRRSRPATSGNKNVNARRDSQPNPRAVIRSRTTPIVGPDRGTGGR